MDNLAISWIAAVTAFLTSIEASAAAATTRYYRTQLMGFVNWAHCQGVSFVDARRTHLERYLITRRAENLSENTINHDYVCVRRFFRYCFQEKYLQSDPMASLRRKRPAEAHVPQPTGEDLRALFASIINRWDPKTNQRARYQSASQRAYFSARDTAIIAFLVDTGARIGNAFSLKLTDYKPGELVVTFVKTKGNRPHTSPLSRECVAMIAPYLKLRPECDSAYLFLSAFGDRLNEGAFSKTFARYIKFAGLNRFTPHGLRHYAISEVAKVDFWAAVAMADHKDPRTTMVYARHDPAHVRDAHNVAGPLSRVVGAATQPSKINRKRIV